MLACATVGGAAVAAGPLSDAEGRGRNIYTHGESLSGRVIRVIDQASETPASASILPCIQCHGEDGRGVSDLGPNIGWDALTYPDGHQHLLRRHGPFDEASFGTAVRDGFDPGGNKLQPTMPRYTMAAEDLSDLVAYLKHIGTDPDPGLSPSFVRIGTVLPTKGVLAGTGNAIREILEAYFADVNAGGGIHGRRVELAVRQYGDDSVPSYWLAQDFVTTESLFALVASYLPEYEEEFSSLAAQRQIPLIGPKNLLSGDQGGRYAFFVEPGLAEQAHALLASALEDEKRPRLALLYPTFDAFDSLAEALRERAASMRAELLPVPYAPGAFNAQGTAERLAAADIDGVVFLGSAGELIELARSCDRNGRQPMLLAPASLAERAAFEVPDSYEGRVFLAYAYLPADRTEGGVRLFEDLHRDFGLDYEYSVAQVSAFSAARVLVEGLQRAGRDLSRERLIESLESLQEFRSGLVPAVTYGPGRRIGASGAYVLQVDLGSGTLDGDRRWVDVPPWRGPDPATE